MKLEWLGHSSFRLTESTGVSIITDPFNGSQVGIPYPEVVGDFITVSHKHYDHDCVKNVQNADKVLDMVGTFECSGVHIYGVMSYHDDKKGALRGKNIVYKYRMDGVELCHLGDIGEELSPMLAELIGSINVLMIPIGGVYTIDAKQAKEYVDFLMPDVVIPMHYKLDGYKMEIGELDEFLDLFEPDAIEYADTTELEFDRTDFDGERTRIIIPKRVKA